MEEYIIAFYLFVPMVFTYEFCYYKFKVKANPFSRALSIQFCTTVLIFTIYCLYRDIYDRWWSYVALLGYNYVYMDSYLLLSNSHKFKGVNEFLVHHIIMFGLLTLHTRFPKLLAIGMLSESSTICINLCWFLIKAGKQNGFLFNFLSLLTIIFFTIFRVIGFTYLVWWKAPLEIKYKLLVSPLLIMNYVWYWKLSQKVLETCGLRSQSNRIK